MLHSDQQLCEKLFDAVSNTLGSMAFMEVSPVPEPALAALPEKLWWFGLDVLAPYAAKLSLLVPPDLAQDIALATFGLGGDEGLSEDMVKDTMAEIVNTVAGVLMSQLLPEDKTFELGLPQADESTLSDARGLVCGFGTDNGIFCVSAEGAFKLETPKQDGGA